MVANQSQTRLVKIWIWQVHFRIVLLSTVEENQTSQPIFNTQIIVSYMLLHNNRNIMYRYLKHALQEKFLANILFSIPAFHKSNNIL